MCTFGFSVIKTPARGKLCKHVQCFSLENMVLFAEATVPRRWRCPICKNKCFEIVIDGYMQKILNGFKEQGIVVKEISFDKEANFAVNKLQTQSEDEDDDEELGEVKRNEPMEGETDEKMATEEKEKCVAEK